MAAIDVTATRSAGGDARLERVDASHLPELLEVSGSVGWRHTAQDWATALASGPVFGHRAAGGTLLSSAAVFPFGPALAAIGMVIVRPEAQRRGLAGALVKRCVAALGVPAPPVTLIATEAGFAVYRRLGFETVDHIVKLALPARAIGGATRGAGAAHGAMAARGSDAAEARFAHERAADADLDAVSALDAGATGADRRAMLGARIVQAGGVWIARAAGGAAAGYAVATRQHEWLVIGPVVARDPADGATLVARAREGHDGPVRIDVPAGAADFIERLRALGFATAEPAPVMLLGGRALPGRREHVLAVATRAFV